MAYDAIVVGASNAGCTAARLLARQGARVALVEKRPAMDAYKVTCTHFIQSSASPVIERLGLAAELTAVGGVRDGIDMWTPHGGWIRAPRDAPRGWNVTRRALDPILRRLAVETPGVDFLPGAAVVGVRANGRVTGVEVEDRHRGRRRIDARLVVAADGRDSTVARLARVPGRVRPHGRFGYFGYYRGIPGPTWSRTWLLDPDFAYTFPNEGGLTVVAVFVHKARLGEFKADLEGSFRHMIDELPDPPDLSGAEREGKLIGKLDMPNVSRPPARPGLAFVGDAALASDPVWGVGCGWAFQSAEWLADAVGPALVGGEDVDAALRRYARAHRRGLGQHHFMIADLASGRLANAPERRMYRAAAADPAVARVFEEIGSRRRQPAILLRPAVLARIGRAARAR